MKNWFATTALTGAFTLISSVSVYAASQPAEINTDDLLNLSLEQLSNIEVTSVSKRSEKASEAAAAIYVITQEDIHQSGMQSIPELLRMVPGLHVAQSGSGQWSISSRGMSGQFADTLLVLIDGRSVYTPLFSGVYWDIQDTPLQDIDRIEVIRGPGATLWGANAVNGVINIITKSAKDTQGGYASASYGSQNSEVSTRYGAKMGEDAYVRAYAKFNDYDPLRNMAGNNANDEWHKGQAGFRSDWKSSETQSYTLQGDFSNTDKRAIQNLYTPMGAAVSSKIAENAGSANILGRWDNKLSNVSNLTVQMYYDMEDRDTFVFNQNIQTFDFDMQHAYSGFSGNEIVWGLGYRLVESNIEGNANTLLGIPYVNILPKKQGDDLYSAFFQDKITLHPDDVFLTLGSKFEHNAYSGFELQPSARLSWLVDDKQTLWSSVSRSVRTPNIGGTNNVQQIAAPFAPTVFYTQVGNPDASSIDMMAYELGYRIEPRKNISIDVSTFYNDYRNMIIGAVTGTSSVGPYTLIDISPENTGEAHTYGAEVSAKWNPTSEWEIAGSYTLLKMKFDQADPLGYNFRDRSPQQEFNLRSTVHLPHDLEWSNSLYYVDQLAAADLNTSGQIPGYFRLDTRLSWKATDNIELSLVGQNLLDNEHQEYYGFAYQNSSQVPRSVYGNIAVKF